MENKKCTKCKRHLPADVNHFKKSKRGKDGFNPQCKECTGSHFKPYIKEGYMICTICKKEYPLDEYHFMKQHDTKTGFKHQCKECLGYQFTKPKPIAKEGFKICHKCNRELPATTDYFFVQKESSYGIMGYCKECGGYNFSQPKPKEGYKRCSKCKKELPKTNQYFSNWVNGKLYPSCRECNSGEYLIDDGYKRCSKCGIVYPATKKYFYTNKTCQYGVSPVCKVCYKEYRKSWTKTEKGKKLIVRIAQVRRSRKRRLAASLTSEEWEECLKFFDYKDAYTGKKMKVITQDHIIPISDGGDYVKENIIPCEFNINASKNNHNMEEWYKNQPYCSDKRLSRIYEWINLNKKTQLTE